MYHHEDVGATDSCASCGCDLNHVSLNDDGEPTCDSCSRSAREEEISFYEEGDNY